MSAEPVDATITELAELAYQAIRGLRRLTDNTALPAPDVYDLLASLKLTALRVGELAEQLAGGLTRSLSTWHVYEDDPGRDPAVSVADAATSLAVAATAARLLSDSLEAAQGAIAGQGYRSRART